jgi:hypothetical protein
MIIFIGIMPTNKYHYCEDERVGGGSTCILENVEIWQRLNCNHVTENIARYD